MDDPIIKQIIDRDCHVSFSYLRVIKHVVSKIEGGYKTFKKLPKDFKKDFMKNCIRIHKQNINLYNYVMRG